MAAVVVYVVLVNLAFFWTGRVAIFQAVVLPTPGLVSLVAVVRICWPRPLVPLSLNFVVSDISRFVRAVSKCHLSASCDKSVISVMVLFMCPSVCPAFGYASTHLGPGLFLLNSLLVARPLLLSESKRGNHVTDIKMRKICEKGHYQSEEHRRLSRKVRNTRSEITSVAKIMLHRISGVQSISL